MHVFFKIYSPFNVLLISKVHSEQWTCFSKSVHHFTCCWCWRKWITHISFEIFRTISWKTPCTKPYCIFTNKRNVRCTVLHTSITDLILKRTIWLRHHVMERRATRSDRTGGVRVTQRPLELPCVWFRFPTVHPVPGEVHAVTKFFFFFFP
jgi:hypothetical protein